MSWQPWGFQSALSSPGRAMGCCQQGRVCSKGAATLSSYFTTQGFHTALLDGKRSVSVSTPDTNGKWDCQPVARYVTAWKKMTLNRWKVLKRRWKWTTALPLSGLLESIQGTGYLCCGLACGSRLWLRMSWNWTSSRHLFLSPPCFLIDRNVINNCDNL